jgi:hypothetical protein
MQRASFTLFYTRINEASFVDKASHIPLFQDTLERKKIYSLQVPEPSVLTTWLLTHDYFFNYNDPTQVGSTYYN